MTELLTAAQMRAIETAAIERGEVTGLELMERAGRGVVEAVFEEWPELAKAPHSAVVLCGPGNNGGDGFVVARLLKEWGWEVEVFLYGDPDKLPPDARVNYERWREMGEVRPLDQERSLESQQNIDADIAIDALFGTGLTRPLSQGLQRIVKEIYFWEDFAVAVDLPSGFCADSGNFLRTSDQDSWDISSQIPLTVTFQRAKAGHFFGEFSQAAQRVSEVDIGLEAWLPHDDGILCRFPVLDLWFEDLAKSTPTHKYTHGHALIFSGPPGARGAARLAARGALRIGAGLVSVVCDAAAIPEHAAQLTAIMLKQADGAGDLTALLEDTRLNALCLGPGLGLDRARALVPVALQAGRAIVLDADALTAFADAPHTLFDMLHETSVLTPHAGEFKRLFPDIAERLNAPPTKGPAYSKVDATREAAKRAGCTILFKGPDTVIAAPDGRCSINSAQYERAAPWLATAGSGDVLAGFITGLLARGLPPMPAAEIAAWLHVEAARSFGPGLIAEDLPEELPKVFRALGL